MSLTKRHRISARAHIPHHEAKNLPEGVKLLAWARTVRWIGWGFGETLLPIFLFSFSVSYAETGLFSSIYDIALLISLPFVGMLADRMSAKVLVLAGLIIYPFVGVGYLLAGVTGLAIFIVAARFINGIAWSLDGVGIDTYYRRMTSRTHLASSFGYIESFAHAGWILAALTGILLVPLVPIHVLLFSITPFALLAIPYVLLAPKDSPRVAVDRQTPSLAIYKNAYREWKGWNGHLRLLALLVFLMGVLVSFLGLFIPINAYIGGANLTMVIILGMVTSIPTLFAYTIGRFLEHKNKYLFISYALFAVALLAIGLALFPSYAFKLVASFLIGVLMEFFTVGGKYLVTTLGPETTYGSRGSAFESIGTLGELSAPLLIGISMDLIGFGGIAIALAVITTSLGVAFALSARGKFL